MVRFLADADFNYAIVKGCRRHEVLAIAAEQNRILVTHDFQTMPRHFGEFLIRRQSSPGVFLVSQYSAIGEVNNELALIWAASEAEEWKNRIVKVPQS